MGYSETRIRPALANSNGKHRFIFVLRPGFSSLELGAGLDSLVAANEVSAQSMFEWEIVSETGEPVRAASGMTVTVAGNLPMTRNGDCIVVCGPKSMNEIMPKRLIAWLRDAKRFGAKLCGLGGGAITLAQARVIKDQRMSTHWTMQHALIEMFDDLEVECSVFENGDDIATSGGGAATLDLFAALITQKAEAETAARVADQLLCGTVRLASDRQTRSDFCRLGTRHERLGHAIRYMEENLDGDLSPSHVAEVVSISTRQLERLFMRHVGSSPKAYITALRLKRARQMLQQTQMRVIDVAVACGFTSASHFSKLYRKHFGTSPHVERGAI